MRILPVKLLFLLNWNRDYFMIITGPFIKSTFAQFGPFLTSPPCSLSEKIIEDVRFWPDPLLPLPFTHPLIGDW